MFKGSAMKKSWLLMALLAALPLATHAEIYKWKDKDGIVRYSDVPPASNIPHETLNSKKVTPPPTTEVAPAPAAPANPDAEAAKRQQQAEQDKVQQQAKDAEQQARQQKCATARTELQKFKVGGRIVRMNEQGEREFLSDADITQGLEQAQKDVAEFCDA
jgi:hypothetical protein